MPLAVLRPRLSVAWLMPSLMWVGWKGAFFYSGQRADRTVFWLVLAGVVAWMLTRAPPRAADGAGLAPKLAHCRHGDEADLPRAHRVLRALRCDAERRRSGGAHHGGLVAGPVALELVPGTGGVFDVDVDGERIFFKKMIGRYPQPDDVLPLLRERIGPEVL